MFYRIVLTDPPTLVDFMSNRTKGRPRRAIESVEEWGGLSVYDDEERARETARKFPRLGAHLAVLDVPPGAPIRWQQTFGPGHYTLWGEPQDVLNCVVSTIPVEVA